MMWSICVPFSLGTFVTRQTRQIFSCLLSSVFQVAIEKRITFHSTTKCITQEHFNLWKDKLSKKVLQQYTSLSFVKAKIQSY